MVKLQTKCKSILTGATFYFHNMKQCKEFLYVFKNHWCNVRWEQAIEVPDDTKMSDYQRKDMDRDPKERAERNLSWGFSLAKSEGTDITTIEQSAFVKRMVDEICSN